jgi:nucleotide-binding universal stress UspA family protein
VRAPLDEAGTVQERVIMVATDGSESARRAEAAARRLAAEGGRELAFVTVWKEPRAMLGVPVRSAIEVEREWAEQTLAEARRQAEAAGLRATTICRRGRPAEEICAAAREFGADMIVLGNHGWGGLEGAVAGSVAHGVLGGAPCPVLVVPEAQPGP